MIEKVLHYLNHFYPHTVETVKGVEVDGITVKKDYIVGQYIYIKDSIMNDGIYKITTITGNKINLDLTAEPTTITVYALAIPKSLLNLTTEIEAYGEKDESLSSESIDDYSVSFKNGSGWEKAFASKLAPYKRVYSDLERIERNWQNRWCPYD